jgi:hypothetical protein
MCRALFKLSFWFRCLSFQVDDDAVIFLVSILSVFSDGIGFFGIAS